MSNWNNPKWSKSYFVEILTEFRMVIDIRPGSLQGLAPSCLLRVIEDESTDGVKLGLIGIELWNTPFRRFQ